jgi:predicted nucleic acid-binding protein
VTQRYLADTSAVGRMNIAEVAATIDRLLLAGDLATCAAVELEVLLGAQDAASYERLHTFRIGTIPMVPLTAPVGDRAIDVQRRLAKRGHHRGVSLPDLLIAACAEAHQLTVLHYDRDFDLIASVTGQPTEWVVPAGTVD